MYLSFYHLKEEPFSMTPDPRFLYFSRQHEDAIESLAYGVKYRKGFLVLTGEIGTGKSTLTRELANRLERDTDIAILLNPLLSVLGLLKHLNRDFGNTTDDDTVDAQIGSLNAFLLERLKKGRNAVVIIDEAQNLSIQALEITRMLSNLETDQQKLLQIILVGQPELETSLKSRHLRQLDQRISVRCDLKPLSYRETKIYVYHRLSVVGGQGMDAFRERSVEFRETAFKVLFDHAKGYPRLINLFCDRALLEGFAKRARVITREIMLQAVGDVTGERVYRPWWMPRFFQRLDGA